jgi:hypothetical protein
MIATRQRNGRIEPAHKDAPPRLRGGMAEWKERKRAEYEGWRKSA